MITLTDEQVRQINQSLSRMQELVDDMAADAIEENALYRKTIDEKDREIERLKAVARQNALVADSFAREVQGKRVAGKPVKVLDSFEDLLGETLRSVEVDNGMDEMLFTLVNGEVYKLYHRQDCCENVYIKYICGDLSDLVGSPILMAEEVTNSEDPPAGGEHEYSRTWTFYKLATINGYVTIRWYGSSNGCYSERVDWELVEGPDPSWIH